MLRSLPRARRIVGPVDPILTDEELDALEQLPLEERAASMETREQQLRATLDAAAAT